MPSVREFVLFKEIYFVTVLNSCLPFRYCSSEVGSILATAWIIKCMEIISSEVLLQGL